MKKIILVNRVKDDFGWLSLMPAFRVVYKGLYFKTGEALFQWMRFEGHPAIQKEILEQKSPMGVKMKARKHCAKLNRRINWDEAPEDIPLMKKRS